MQMTLFSGATRRITKLTDKAKAALDEKIEGSSKKRKNDDSSTSTTRKQLKKVKSTQQSGDDVDEAPSEEAPTMAQRSQPIVQTEEEEALSAKDAIVLSDDEEEEESAENELKWISPIYAFFNPTPVVETIDGCCAHSFKCTAKGCKVRIRRFLDKKDARSTGNMRKHVKICWGEEVLQAADEAKNAEEVRMKIVPSVLRNGSIMASFERKGKGQVTYSHWQHTHTETKAELVHWILESLWPFDIVKDRGFQLLMKTGRPEYYIPSPRTVSCDVRLVFARTRQQIAKMLGGYEGKMNFTTDTWTSENHRAFVAFAVHLEHKGIPLSFPLDIIEVATSHTGEQLAAVFADMLREFGISDKMLSTTCDNASNNNVMIDKLATLVPEFAGDASHTRCFLHTVNLVAKSLICEFDVSKKNAECTWDKHAEGVDDELVELSSDIEREDRQVTAQYDHDVQVSEEETQLQDNDEGWVNEVDLLSDEQSIELQKDIQPVKLVLLKVC
ncbi:hypothetical protein AZE42_10848 [Rhizopogon vesiculosus]|uniref:DUF659 domain-containing protein n=1 Tax=Rhizopogon vesiculosus TaxID=180088 RepID=A0A1J8QF32_9AGAM|nr:hypothetical protein AZE42_10848 [Rhizopogon vesiculosus]